MLLACESTCTMETRSRAGMCSFFSIALDYKKLSTLVHNLLHVFLLYKPPFHASVAGRHECLNAFGSSAIQTQSNALHDAVREPFSAISLIPSAEERHRSSSHVSRGKPPVDTNGFFTSCQSSACPARPIPTTHGETSPARHASAPSLPALSSAAPSSRTTLLSRGPALPASRARPCSYSWPAAPADMPMSR